MRKDYRDTLPDIKNIHMDYMGAHGHGLFQLIDGRDIMVFKNDQIKLWNGYTWSSPNISHYSDYQIMEIIEKAKAFGFFREGWNVLTGPGIESYQTELTNPYCFKLPMLLPFDSFPIGCEASIDGIEEWKREYRSPGVVYKSGPVIGLSKSDNFGNNTNIITGRPFLK